jgi:hypothetical protein
MITLKQETADLIKAEMESIPEKYWKPFNSTHEGYAVLLEEVREIEHVVFFGEKECNKEFVFYEMSELHFRNRLREEAVQIAAMACRIIQELT